MISKSRGAWLIALLLLGSAVKADANLVSDPGFELGTPDIYTGSVGDGWVVTTGIGAICGPADGDCANAGEPHTGSQMAFLGFTTSFNTIAQDLTTVAGQIYEISYWVADGEADPLIVRFGSSTLFAGNVPSNGTSSGDYVEYTFDATTTSTNILLSFSGEGGAGGGGILLDDVSVNAVPEPATWPVIAAAVLGLAMLRRRYSKIAAKAGQ